DADGGAVLVDSDTLNGNYGLNGYLDIAAQDIVPTLYFWSFPLSEAQVDVGYAIGTGTWAQLDAAAAPSGVTLDSSRGHLLLGSVDCSGVPAHETVFSVHPIDDKTRMLYVSGITPSATATSTDSRTGLAFVLNVPEGQVDVTMTPQARGVVASRVKVVV